ncbi:MAG TPA: methylated-DNA--[protein]-cysteine S-methyltransferase [Planctomycetota bacterium]|nr:methylated-DNA--[protein]-cysteine S-methyltransferase [Planctomycetota bacterium]
MIAYDVIDTPAGRVTVEMERGKVVAVSFGDRPRHPSRPEKLPEARRWLGDWFKGLPVKPPLKLEGPPFTRRVYEIVRRIPRGKTLSYGEVADAAGNPGAARAVGNVMSQNPVCLFIPCHRVVASTGIGGWGGEGGLRQKQLLLDLEGDPGNGEIPG